MNVNDFETGLRNAGQRSPSRMPAFVAERIETALAALPDRAIERRKARRWKSAAAIAASLAIFGGSVAGYDAFAPDRTGESVQTRESVQSQAPSRQDFRSEVDKLAAAIKELDNSIRLSTPTQAPSREEFRSEVDKLKASIKELQNSILESTPTQLPLSQEITSEVDKLAASIGVTELTNSIREMTLQQDRVSDALPGITDKGITVKFGSLSYDYFGLAIRYSVTSEKPIEDFSLNAVIAIDGQTIGYVGKQADGSYGTFRNEYEIVNAKRIEGVLKTESYPFEGYRMQHSDLEIDISRIGSVGGEWKFNSDIQGFSPLIVDYFPGSSIKASRYEELELSKIRLSRVSTQIDYKFAKGERTEDREVGFVLEDDTGYRYGIHWLKETAEDQVGRASFPVLSTDSKSLKIRPFYRDRSQSSGSANRVNVNSQPSEQKPIVLSIGEAGKLYITGIEYRTDQTVVRTRTEPKDAIVDFKLLDDKGNSLPLIGQIAGQERQTVFAPVKAGTKLLVEAAEQPKTVYIPEMEFQIDLP